MQKEENMRLRIALARSLIRLGNFIQSIPIMVMRPDDLVEFSRQTYARQSAVSGWSDPELVNEGLYAEESELLKKIPDPTGRLLLLGVGGGREVIPLARLGFQVTGVDFVPEMLEQAKRNAARQGIKIDGLVQEISRLELPENTYDLTWLSAAMYSCVPTRKRRLEMLRRIYKALRPGGFFICQFHWGAGKMHSSPVERARKAVAWLTLGNIPYEPGDMLWHNIEFIHGFLSIEELNSEFQKSGFEVTHLSIPEQRMRGGAVLKKPV
jgi:SAM-dependent methyltransferase